MDLATAAIALLLLSPVMLILALVIAAKLGRPVFFFQERTGWRREPFHVIKFRSMLDAVDDHGRLLDDEQRLTRFGRFLREWSLDEIPALWNILRGEMSVVGPRPLIHRYNDLYTAQQAQRFLVRPGITGWAQVNGRNSLSWPEKFALDRWYVENLSFRLDLTITMATLWKVITRHGVSADGCATMPEFRGERESALREEER